MHNFLLCCLYGEGWNKVFGLCLFNSFAYSSPSPPARAKKCEVRVAILLSYPHRRRRCRRRLEFPKAATCDRNHAICRPTSTCVSCRSRTH